MKQGFTLIELLVVVLIIGILAAVALPQYQTAVEKSRLASLIPLMRSVFEANQEHYLSNGTYTNDINAWAISLPNVKEIKDVNPRRKEIIFNNGSYLTIQQETDITGDAFVSGHVPSVPAYLHRYYDPTKSWRCYATSQEGIPLCRSFGCTGTIPINVGGCPLSL